MVVRTSVYTCPTIGLLVVRESVYLYNKEIKELPNELLCGTSPAVGNLKQVSKQRIKA